MKMYMAFFICFVSVLGHEFSDHEKRINEMAMAATKTCALELEIDIPDDKSIPNYDEEACIKACVDKKLGVMNEDGKYNIERIMALFNTAKGKKLAEESYGKKIKECTSIVDEGGACKMAACVHRMPKCAYMKDLHC